MEFREYFKYTVLKDFMEIGNEISLKILDISNENLLSGKKTVIGVSSGSAAVGVFRSLIKLFNEKKISFKEIIFFQINEFYPISQSDIHSNACYLAENLFCHIDIPDENVNYISADLNKTETREFCNQYEQKIRELGGMDIAVLDIGRNGNLGFNEPGTVSDTITRIVHLEEITRGDSASDFFGAENVPYMGITMGISTLMSSKRVYILGVGDHKSKIIRRILENPPANKVPASLFSHHESTDIYLDEACTSDLTRYKTPWKIGPVKWDSQTAYRAVIWLAGHLEKSILKLTHKDYEDNKLIELVNKYKSTAELNETIHHSLLSKIVTSRNIITGKKVLIFSPHPDDDVICAGGIMDKLVRNNNEIRTAYMTNGSLAVFDDNVRRHLNFLNHSISIFSSEFKNEFIKKAETINRFLDKKKPGEVDTPDVQTLKANIRKSEAIAACNFLGINDDKIYFLDLPFYQTGKVDKNPISDADINIVLNCLNDFQPDIIFAAGDLSDPHGTHRMCNEVIYQALDRYEHSKPQIWLYRGAWQEWDIEKVSAFFPLSESEMKRKILTIFKHESQKDKALFPGPFDDREFWQRTEARNLHTAWQLNLLGLPEYYAMEAMVID